MKQAIIGTAVLFLCCLAGSAAAGYKIERIIDVGPSKAVPYLWPLKWSPDGTKLAYVASDGKLMTSDTLGKSQEIAPMEWPPRRMEWMSNTEIAVNLERRFGRDSTLHRLSVFTLGAGQEKVVARYTRTMGDHDIVGHTSFDGPYISLGGKVYYCTAVSQGRGAAEITARSWMTLDDSSRAKSDDRMMVWGSDGLYDIPVAGGDSVRLIERVIPVGEAQPDFTAVNHDRTCVMYGGDITRLKDLTRVAVYDRIPAIPPGTSVCGFMYLSFHPTKDVVLFELTCDDGETYVVGAIGTYNMVTDEFVVLDSLLNMTNCHTPVYSPHGNKIAFQANGHTFIVYTGGE